MFECITKTSTLHRKSLQEKLLPGEERQGCQNSLRFVVSQPGVFSHSCWGKGFDPRVSIRSGPVQPVHQWPG